MLTEDAVFGGESSGHYFYRLPYGTFESPTRLVQKFLEYVTVQNKPVSELVAPHKKYANSGEMNVRLDVRLQGEMLLEKIKEKYANGKQLFIDGLTVEYPDFWFSVRLSNTEPLVRLIVESPDQAIMEKQRDELLALIRSMLH
jgi:phosphomannomutase